MKIGISLPKELVAFADQVAEGRGISRSAFLASLFEAERARLRTRRYLDRYGWDVTENEAAWRRFQRRRMAVHYADDDWSVGGRRDRSSRPRSR